MKRYEEMKQDYARYTEEDQLVWQILYIRQMKKLPDRASRAYLQGLQLVGFQEDRIPDFDEVNQRLNRLTGWKLRAVPGIVDNALFFEMLSQRHFPASTWLRSMKELDYLEEPDMFHDVFAHVPLLSNPDFCDFLSGLSEIALKYVKNEEMIELLSRIYWFTVEFGLIREEGLIKIYGAGILSSTGESDYCLRDEVPRLQFDVRKMLSTSYIKEKFQEKYFLIDRFEQLNDSLPQIEKELLELEKRGALYNTAR